MLDVQDVAVSYDQAIALRGVSMSIRSGQSVSLIGSNGAGKSTLVKALMGMQPVRGGRILFEGQDLAGSPSSSRPAQGIALVPEARRLFPHLSVWDNLQMGLHDRAARARSRGGLDWVLHLFPVLTERSRQKAGTLSGGEQQMVAIGRALISRPRLLILDEPSLGLAPIVVERVFRLLEEVRTEGVTMLIAEQNMHAALSMSDFGYVLDDGRVTMSGPSAELLTTPAVRAAYLGGT